MYHLIGKSGIEWHYDIQGEGPDLVFLHGWGVDKRIWRQQTKHFSDEYRVMSIDLPGHGKSSFEKVDLTAMGEDIHNLFKKENFTNIRIVGSSLGGMFAFKLYELHPQVFQKMAFVGSMPKFSQSVDFPHGLDIERMAKLDDQLQTDYPNIVNIFFRSLFTREERQSRRYKWLQKFRQNIDIPMKQALREYLDLLEDEDLRHVLKSIDIPVQFITGTGDEICTPQTVAALKELAPDAHYHDFEKCGHFPFLSKPHEFNEVLETFLKN